MFIPLWNTRNMLRTKMHLYYSSITYENVLIEMNNNVFLILDTYENSYNNSVHPQPPFSNAQ